MISPRGGVAYGNEARPTLNPFLRYLRAFRSPRRGPDTPFGGRILIRVGIGLEDFAPGGRSWHHARPRRHAAPAQPRLAQPVQRRVRRGPQEPPGGGGPAPAPPRPRAVGGCV